MPFWVLISFDAGFATPPAPPQGLRLPGCLVLMGIGLLGNIVFWGQLSVNRLSGLLCQHAQDEELFECQ